MDAAEILQNPTEVGRSFFASFCSQKEGAGFLPYPAIRRILPGFMMFFGSSACLMARMAAISTGEA